MERKDAKNPYTKTAAYGRTTYSLSLHKWIYDRIDKERTSTRADYIRMCILEFWDKNYIRPLYIENNSDKKIVYNISMPKWMDDKLKDGMNGTKVNCIRDCIVGYWQKKKATRK